MLSCNLTFLLVSHYLRNTQQLESNPATDGDREKEESRGKANKVSNMSFAMCIVLKNLILSFTFGYFIGKQKRR